MSALNSVSGVQPDYDMPDDVGHCDDCDSDHRPSEDCRVLETA